MTQRWICQDCRACWPEAELLTAPHPFDYEALICGCPGCLGLDLVRACDEPDCGRESRMGTPTPDGYRRTCYEHRPAVTPADETQDGR